MLEVIFLNGRIERVELKYLKSFIYKNKKHISCYGKVK